MARYSIRVELKGDPRLSKLACTYGRSGLRANCYGSGQSGEQQDISATPCYLLRFFGR